MHVRDKFPAVDESIAVHLGKSISLRRQRIRNLANPKHALAERTTSPSAIQRERVSIEQPRAEISGSASSNTRSSNMAYSIQATTVEPVKTRNEDLRRYGPSSPGSSTSSVAPDQSTHVEPIKTPNRPMGTDGEVLANFECPYCSTVQQIASDETWQKHVLTDLQPYICIYPECGLHAYMFSGRDEWFSHEAQYHQHQLHCNTEGHEEFRNVAAFLNHMKTEHQEFLKESQLPAIRRVAERPTESASGTCPLCLHCTERLKTHLARHLEELALFSIPQTHYMTPDLVGPDSDVAQLDSYHTVGLRTSLTRESDFSIEFHPEDLSELITQVDYEPTPPDCEEQLKNGVDISWDAITIKFRAARAYKIPLILTRENPMPTQSEEALKHNRDRALNRTGESLYRDTINADDISNAYIRYQDMRHAWSGRDTIRDSLYPAHLSEKLILDIEEKFMRFLSILVYINARDCLAEFQNRFIDANGDLICTDSDLPLGDMNVEFLDEAHRSRFLALQYLFIPKPIVVSAGIQHIDDKFRLPFEEVSRNVVTGVYGTIDKVKISARYFQNEGYQAVDAKYVACKRLHVEATALHRQSEYLQVVKETLTSHENIRLHISIIARQTEQIIILPWTDHLDLDIFLLEGHNLLGDKVYEFRNHFSEAKPEIVLAAVCIQMRNLAQALRWLHQGVSLRSDRIGFTLMNLKPNNIFIEQGDSAVGRWVITDFAISAFALAFNKDEGSEHSKYVSIRDYYQILTHETQVRRPRGPYRPPEAEQIADNGFEGRITADQGRAAQRGDIWSFGCIASEVLTFALGRAALVKLFRDKRRGGLRHTGYFYEEVSANSLRHEITERAYRVRPCIVSWLRRLPLLYAPVPRKAIECCVESILQILVTDASRRPTADELLSGMSHVAKHIGSHREGYDSKEFGRPDCPFDRPVIQPGDSINEPTQDPVLHHGYESMIGRIARRVGDGRPAAADTPSTPLEPLDSESLQVVDMHHGRTSPSPRGSYGVLIDQEMPRKASDSIEVTPFHLRKKKIVAHSLCPTGCRVAHLWEDNKQFGITLSHISLVETVIERIEEIELSGPGITWRAVRLAGEYLVTWGSDKQGSEQVHLVVLGNASPCRGLEKVDLADLSMIAISLKGRFALVFGKAIIYGHVDSTVSQAHISPEEIQAKGDHKFSDVAFNDDGSLLYAWEIGRLDDRLNVWQIEDPVHRLRLPAYSEGSYRALSRPGREATLIPYNSHPGCIIQDHDAKFFVAQILRTEGGSTERIPRIIKADLNKPVAACMFNDHSILTLERSLLRRPGRIREHRIISVNKSIIQPSVAGTRMKRAAEEGTQMRVVSVPETDDLVIVICMPRGNIELIPVRAELD
ncbi:hypothetical protein BCR34DRAFT_60772 [Clohesyomyces aquaticus]|uniref:Protein kinase domain-containing protein n=1 Tax=Clohesyomyces aquaticus TaxID=1231657 RepID=A0A1Y2A417_9PLEO|nr:hypothetical protein BCR34DRAFT_60772 [Clohesyomyces aquaticus]